ncbi:MAG: PHB depolymerase family esterase [Fibrobacterota bacterium]|nr:PHB depolymerase family esterase [Fibrobacterota bacterium]QQS06498.1 MAG: PHB depolymerase family esterase [Fibrobacterota bacterium]
MNRRMHQGLRIALGGLLLAQATGAVTLTEVPVATWKGSVNLPSYAKMYVYVPAKLAAKPPIVVSNHSCGSTASGQAGNMTKFLAASDKNGFLMIFPDNPGQNCWDVGTKAALTHDGGGDPHAIATMVRYALKKYNGDSSRVYVVGGSSGAMMTQALLGVYPEMFMAGAPRAGVPCGCWAESYASSNQWSSPCASGTVTKTAQQWGDYVRAINPSYKGHRPRVQIYHGESDQTISFNNFGEGIKEWTNVLGLSTTPTSTSKPTTPAYTYNRQTWKNSCGVAVLDAWSAPGQPHSMTYEEDTIMKFFGLQTADSKDPEAACNSGIEAAKPTTSPVSYLRQDQALVLDGNGADKVDVKIWNTSGQIQYGSTIQVGAHSAAVSVGLSALQSGYYLASATYLRSGRVTGRSNMRFVVVP